MATTAERIDPREVDRADVYKGEVLAARLTRMGGGVVDFRYLPEYLDAAGPPVAFRLPVQPESLVTTGGSVPPFFANLLPEGARFVALRDRIRASADDMLSLILPVGGDCVGDVSVVPEGSRPAPGARAPEGVSWSDLSFDELFRRSVSVEPGDHDPAALPGAQEKVSDAVVSFPVATRGLPRLLKLSPPRFPLIVENEDFFLRMAGACGLETASAEVVRDRDGAAGLLVERFDRRLGPEGEVRRLGLEDGCQLCDAYPADKYNLRTLEVAQSLARFGTSGPAAVAGLLELLAFSFLIGNEDLHAKNVSLLVEPDGIVRFAPGYDILSTLPYAIDHQMAMEFEGRRNKFSREDFLAFARRLGVGARAVERALDRICDLAPPWLDRLGEIGFEDRQTELMREEMLRRRDRLPDGR